MATSELSIINNLKMFRKKRMYFLFFLHIPYLLVLISFLVLYFTGVLTQAPLITVYFVVSIAMTLAYFATRNKYMFIVMQTEYFKMLYEDNGPISIYGKLYTTSWIDSFKRDEFIQGPEYADYTYFYKFIKKSNELIRTKNTFLCIVIAKNSHFDFYGDAIDREIQTIFMNYKDSKKIKKQVVIQYKKYEEFSKSIKNQADQIINFKFIDQYIVHVNVAYFAKESRIYYLHPQKRFPNKYYYYACKLIEKYSNVSN